MTKSHFDHDDWEKFLPEISGFFPSKKLGKLEAHGESLGPSLHLRQSGGNFHEIWGKGTKFCDTPESKEFFPWRHT